MHGENEKLMSIMIVYSYSLKIEIKNWPLDKFKDVTFPWSSISVDDCSVRVSQNLTFLSKCPEIIVVAALSEATTSLQLEPANIVLIPEINYKILSLV